MIMTHRTRRRAANRLYSINPAVPAFVVGLILLLIVSALGGLR